jgi:LmbE family N-acetylglucosaminyl deacetylase
MPVDARLRRAAKRAVRIGSSSAVRAAGVDVTEQFAERSCLVVAPHPDDETFGCGATIARKRAHGVDVHVVIVADGRQSPRPDGMSETGIIELRRAECTTALQSLGVEASAVVHLDFEDGALSARTADISDALADQIRRTAPSQVLVTSTKDRHPDHSAVGRALRATTRDASIELFEYAIWQRVPALAVASDALRSARPNQGSRAAGRPSWRPRLVRTDGFLEEKRAAIDSYASQLPHFPVGFVEDFLLPFEAFTALSPVRQA